MLSDTSSNDSAGSKTHTLSNLRHCIEDSPSKRLIACGEERGNNQIRNRKQHVCAHWIKKHRWESTGPVCPVWLDDTHEQQTHARQCNANQTGVVSAESVRNEAHDYISQRTADWRGQEAQTRLDGRDLLDVLEEQCLIGLCGIECAPDDENAGTDDTEYAVPP